MKMLNLVSMSKFPKLSEVLEQESQRTLLERINLSEKIKKGKIVCLATLALLATSMTPLTAHAVTVTDNGSNIRLILLNYS